MLKNLFFHRRGHVFAKSGTVITVPVSRKVPVFSGIKVSVPVKVLVFENLEFLVPVLKKISTRIQD